MKKGTLFFFIFIITSLLLGQNSMIKTKTPKRPKDQKDVLELKCDPIPVVRIAFIGLGMRGEDAVRRYMYLDGIEIVALCDVVPEKIEKCQKTLEKNNKQRALSFTGTEDWKLVCQLENVDLVYVCTQWDLHTPIALEAMKNGKHVALEVPAALSMEECWQLVNYAEKYQRHCIMLENCVYDFFEMATLNMTQKGVFGEIVHVEGAYIHDLRWLQFDDVSGYWNNWRLKYNTNHTGNPYPTHGLGPIATILNLHRGDKMNYLVSVSSDQFGMSLYAKDKFPSNEPKTKQNYLLGDMNTTIIKTQMGKTIMLQHDITSPRPYSRHHLISGTKGFAQKYPFEVMAFEPNAHQFITEQQMEDTLKKYDHPFNIEIGELAKKVGGHGGMDFVMDYRLIYCLRNGLPLDMDVYDAAEWSCIVPLSEISVLHNGAPVEIPDFTRGSWKKLQKLDWKIIKN